MVVQKNTEKITPEMFRTKLKKLRQKIDNVDKEIIEGIAKRLLLSFQVGLLKQRYDQPIYNLQREKEVIEKVIKLKKPILNKLLQSLSNVMHLKTLPSHTLLLKALSDQTIRLIYKEIISASRTTEEPLRIAYLGAPGSFSHIASLSLFGSSSEYIPYGTFNRIFQALAHKKEPLALIPIENSTEGIVGTTVDLMVVEDVAIVTEFFMPIRLVLLSRTQKLSEVRTIVSHPQPLSQAQQWISDHLPDITLKQAQSTSQAAELALKHPNYACITSPQLAMYYPKLEVLRRDIEDHQHNTTRFFVIRSNTIPAPHITLTHTPRAPKKHPTKTPWVTTLIFSTKDKSGSLQEILMFFKIYKINMSNLVSRPSKKKAFDYLFYVDFMGHHKEPHVEKALASIKKHTKLFKLLGSYLRGEVETTS